MSSSSPSAWFAGRSVAIASMHHKERVIAPLLSAQLKVNPFVCALDTDQFGTFTRDIKRLGTQIETARRKAQAALALTGVDLAIASEGSFFPHPDAPWLGCNREIVLLIDQKNQLEWLGQTLSERTNHQNQRVTSWPEALAFAETIGFPDHGLVVFRRSASQGEQILAKGLTSESALCQALESALAQNPGEIYLETDMRALYNPTRMAIIEQATQNLLETLQCFCPSCHCPGFTVQKREAGLPCAWCGGPTALIQTEIYGCQRCDCQQTREVNPSFADPMYCCACNP
ncbi:DUF6671 family protein [Synechocystis sp. LKSZ1]|uniref:DUF6671 family protein n=1 Tax=Synechocystis sp. LKSZ1 TaxID=3144951 RepID=UPI00336BC8A1